MEHSVPLAWMWQARLPMLKTLYYDATRAGSKPSSLCRQVFVRSVVSERGNIYWLGIFDLCFDYVSILEEAFRVMRIRPLDATWHFIKAKTQSESNISLVSSIS